MSKKNWDQYFMEITEKVSERATCNRKHVGAIIVKDKRILATGFNGSISKTPECDKVGHMMEDNHCIRTIHAEINAISQCAKFGISCNEASIYINTFPCWSCFKTTINSGIKEIYYRSEYTAIDKKKIVSYAKKLKIKLEKI